VCRDFFTRFHIRIAGSRHRRRDPARRGERLPSMSTLTAPAQLEHDAADLAGFGYQQQLHRKLGGYASFAAGFSFVSIMTTVFQLFGFGFGFGGPAFFWTWPLVFTGQLLVALNFAELAAHYPIAGCIYQWSRRLSIGVTGWFAGWTMLVGQIISVSAAAIALQVVLPSIWPGFQLFGGDPALASKAGATNAVVLGAILIAVTTVVNAIGVKVMSFINSLGVTCELIGIVLLVALLFTRAERGPAVVLHTNGDSHYIGAFLVSALMAAYVMYGFDSAGELSEETRAPRRTAPRAIVRALVASGIGGALLLVAALMAAPSVTDGKLASGGLPYVLTSRLGTGVGKALLIDVAVAITVCTLAIQTAATRLTFSMSRDGVLPWSGRLATVNRRTGTPILPAVVVGLLATAILLVNVGQAQLFTALTSVAVVVVYSAYLLVTIPLLVRRRQGWPIRHGATAPDDPGATASHFSLGRAGFAINALAVGYGLFMVVNMAWPRAVVYDPAGGHWYLQWFAELFVLGVAALGALAYLIRNRQRGDVAGPAEVALAVTE
jgi:urea carboxylase system permease